MNFAALLLTLVAPLPYWALGLPWLNSQRLTFAPLLGCALAGLYAEWAMIAGLPVRATIAVLVVASAAIAAYRLRAPGAAMREFTEWLPFYCVAVLAASISPFPVVGAWSGDWLIMYRMGEAVLGGNLPSDMLTRPPLFGAATAPLWLLQSGLIPYQLMAAVASAAAVAVTLQFIRVLRPGAGSVLLLPLLLSPFFLHHTAAAWSKMLAAGLVLAALMEALRLRRWTSAVFFALAVAVHEGYVIWAPCLLLCHATGPERWRGAAKAVTPMAVAGLLLTGPIVFWIVGKYGLAAKIAASPSITELDAVPMPVALKNVLGVIAAFVGWGPLEVLVRWFGGGHATESSVVAKESYWLITSWVTTLAGTMAGLLFPFLAARRELRSAPGVPAPFPWGLWAIAGIGIAVVLNSVLAGFYSNQGTMQNGLVPLGLGAYAVLAARLAALGERGRMPLRHVAWVTALIGTAPWLLMNLGIGAGVRFSPTVRQRFLAGSESDYIQLMRYHLEPLGMAAVPAVPCLAAAFLIILLVVRQRASPASVV